MPGKDGPVDRACSAELWTASIDDFDGAREAAYLALLSDEEHRRAAQFRVETARRLYVLAHALCRILLGTLLNRPARSLRFTIERHGKPRLDLPAAGLEFSLSHGGRLAVCAASWDAPVGVDVEPIFRGALTL